MFLSELLLRTIVTLDGLGDDRTRRVTSLVVLTLRRHRPRDVATHQRYADKRDNQKLPHNQPLMRSPFASYWSFSLCIA